MWQNCVKPVHFYKYGTQTKVIINRILSNLKSRGTYVEVIKLELKGSNHQNCFKSLLKEGRKIAFRKLRNNDNENQN